MTKLLARLVILTRYQEPNTGKLITYGHYDSSYASVGNIIEYYFPTACCFGAEHNAAVALEKLRYTRHFLEGTPMFLEQNTAVVDRVRLGVTLSGTVPDYQPVISQRFIALYNIPPEVVKPRELRAAKLARVEEIISAIEAGSFVTLKRK